MNRDDIIRMAQEAGMLLGRFDVWDAESSDLERFFHMAYAAGAAAEREVCAKVCESLWDYPENGMATEEEHYGNKCADHLRARGRV